MEREWKPNVELSPACPRCGSSNTKFCYYNNYSLTQPRYFCKACRRYWTKGGSLRNVPVGGGCRKSRRGKSIRVAGVASRTSLSPRGGIESSKSNSSCPDASATIDLAAVYANFLNQAPQVENRVEVETHSQILVPSCAGFSDFQALDVMSSHLNLESTAFLECRQLPGNLPETRLLEEGNTIYYDGYDDFSQKDQLIPGGNGNNFSGIIGSMENTALPPLPGEDDRRAVPDGVPWPAGPDVMLPEQIMPSEMAAAAEPEGLNSEVLNGELSPFSALNLEAIFRS